MNDQNNPNAIQYNFCLNCGAPGLVKHNDTHYECRPCGKHFWNNAKAATAMVLIKDGQMLVTKRARVPNKGKYELPGGFIDFGETAYVSAIREASEELGITINEADMQVLDVYYNDYNPGVFSIDIAFLVADWQGELTPGDDVAAIEWKSFDFIYDAEFCQSHYIGLDKLISARLQI